MNNRPNTLSGKVTSFIKSKATPYSLALIGNVISVATAKFHPMVSSISSSVGNVAGIFWYDFKEKKQEELELDTARADVNKKYNELLLAKPTISLPKPSYEVFYLNNYIILQAISLLLLGVGTAFQAKDNTTTTEDYIGSITYGVSIFLALANEYYVDNNIQSELTKINNDILTYKNLLSEAKDDIIHNQNTQLNILKNQLAAAEKAAQDEKIIINSLATASGKSKNKNKKKVSRNAFYKDNVASKQEQIPLTPNRGLNINNI